MTMLEKLDFLMLKNGLNKHSLAAQADIPYTTIIGLYTKGTEKAKLPTLRKLADFFEVSLDYLTRDDIDNPHYAMQKENATPEEIENDVNELAAWAADNFGDIPKAKMELIVKLAQAVLDSDI